uniref:Uncharacterized protein n=1 Tax=Anguilla anguilla TaxID=7936 RepID=A0A0E9WK81_ANGAN
MLCKFYCEAISGMKYWCWNILLEQGCPTLILEIYGPVGFNFNHNWTHLILLICIRSLVVE